MKTIVCVPYFGPKDLEHDICMRDLRRTHDVVEVYDVPWIDQARSVLVARALKAGADVVVFIDHDIVFRSQDVERIAKIAAERNAVVAAAYSRKKLGQPLVGAFDPSVEKVTFYEGGDVYPAALVGLGFTAIPSSIFALMSDYPEVAVAGGERVRPYFLPAITADQYMGEDVAFCSRVRSHKASLFIDTTVRLLHRGSFAFSIEDAGRTQQLSKSVVVELKQTPAAPQKAPSKSKRAQKRSRRK